MVTTVNLYSLRSLLRSYFWAFLITTVLVAAVVFAFNKPQTVKDAIGASRFSSSASLLLSSSRQFHSKGLFASRDRGDLEIWLLDENLFAQMLERERFYNKLDAALTRKDPKLARYARGVQVKATYQYFYGGPVQEFDVETQEAAEYASLEDQGDGSPRRFIRKPTRIVIQAVGPDPEISQQLAQVSVGVMQLMLEQVATRRVRSQRKVIEGYLQAAQRKVARAEKDLSHFRSADPDEIHWLERRRAQLRDRSVALENQLSSLRRQVDSERVILTSEDGQFAQNQASKQLEELEAKRRQAQQVLLPESDAYRQLVEKVEAIRRLVRKLKEEKAQRALASLEAEEFAKRALFQQVRQELNDLEGRLPSTRAQRKFRDRLQQLEAWQVEVLTWDHKLLEVRIEECLCKNEGLSTLLLSPTLGTRLEAGRLNLSSYQRVVRFLPLAPLLGLLAMLFLHALRGMRRIGSKMEFYLDAPLLAEIKSPGVAELKRWDLAVRGRSLQKSNAEE